jgi:HAD superfamily hydrolase (TIGR01509 family)
MVGDTPDAAAGRQIGVLFDMDGTLVDSEHAWTTGFADLAHHYGGVLTAPARARMTGNNMVAQMRILHDAIEQPYRSVDESAAWLSARMDQLFTAGLHWRPGGERLLRAVREAGMRTALVTATRRPLVVTALELLVEANFDAVVTGDDVKRPKPDPEPYRNAANTLGLDPARCVAIEDSPSGAASAYAAGCAVVVVPSEVPFPVPPDVLTVASLDDLSPATIRSLIERR